jgi:hypothetical protein
MNKQKDKQKSSGTGAKRDREENGGAKSSPRKALKMISGRKTSNGHGE